MPQQCVRYYGTPWMRAERVFPNGLPENFNDGLSAFDKAHKNVWLLVKDCDCASCPTVQQCHALGVLPVAQQERIAA